jgi:hypothetical protein
MSGKRTPYQLMQRLRYGKVSGGENDRSGDRIPSSEMDNDRSS